MLEGYDSCLCMCMCVCACLSVSVTIYICIVSTILSIFISTTRIVISFVRHSLKFYTCTIFCVKSFVQKLWCLFFNATSTDVIPESQMTRPSVLLEMTNDG